MKNNGKRSESSTKHLRRSLRFSNGLKEGIWFYDFIPYETFLVPLCVCLKNRDVLWIIWNRESASLSPRHGAVRIFYLQHSLWRQKDFTPKTEGTLQVKGRKCQFCDCWGIIFCPMKWPWNAFIVPVRDVWLIWLENMWAWKWTALLGWACLLERGTNAF